MGIEQLYLVEANHISVEGQIYCLSFGSLNFSQKAVSSGNWPGQRQDPWKCIDASSPIEKFKSSDQNHKFLLAGKNSTEIT
jgi:hypothetical protein